DEAGRQRRDPAGGVPVRAVVRRGRRGGLRMDESLGPPPPPGDEGPAGGPAAKPRDPPGPVALPEAADHPLSQGPGPVVVGAYSLDPADPGETRSVLGGVRDNLEAIAFALVLALLLRHFCIEVFKIP